MSQLTFTAEPFVGYTEFDELEAEGPGGGWEGEVNRSGAEYTRWVQQSLNRVMGLQLAVDGVSGTKTRSAIRSFQQQRGLVADGIVGRITEAALVSAGASPPPGSQGQPGQPGAPGVIDGRIDVHAQQSLLRLLKGGDASGQQARALLEAVKTQGKLGGIYIENQQVPAQLAKRLGVGWWQLIPKGADAAVAVNPADPSSPGLIVFRDQIRSDARRLDIALLKAWAAFQQAQKMPASVRQAVAAVQARGGAGRQAEAELFSVVSGALSLFIPIPALSLPSVRALDAAEIAVAKPVFGSSLDFGRILVSSALGLGGAPFTLYVPPPVPFVPDFTVLNMGPGPYSSPASNKPLLIHELVHSWQSQHHSTPYQYEINSVASQGLAAAYTKLTGDAASAYCYKPGGAFGTYAAEQIANSVENHFRGTGGAHEAAIAAHVKSVAAGAVSAENVASLSTPRFEPRSAPGVTC